MVVFLGAGFSAVGGVPLARELFDAVPAVDRVTRQRLLARVQAGWLEWSRATGGTPEEYLAHLEMHPSRAWADAVWYVALVMALHMGRVELVGGRLTITRHNLNRTTGIAAHEEFWTAIFRHTADITVLTVSYDILPERGLRIAPHPRVPRPGFNYGEGPVQLQGGGYPSYAHLQRIAAIGHVPLLKLHGSVSWSRTSSGALRRYHDCRPAVRDDGLIVAPITEKRVPASLQPTWNAARAALSGANMVLVVGYSLPEYDRMVLDLLRAACPAAQFHVFDTNPAMADGYESALQRSAVQHRGLPDGTADVELLAQTANMTLR